MRLLALSDLHLGHARNREALERLGHYPDDWLILAGDVGDRPGHLELALRQLVPRFQRLVWTPGNHDLWRAPGQARYDELVAICRAHGVVTPEDPYPVWPGDAGTFIVPMFLLYDYSFRPSEVPIERAVAWARAGGIRCRDEHLLDPAPWPSRRAWCHARCAETVDRLAALPAGARTVLVGHWPLRCDLARPPRIPRFSVWCGTELTETWAVRFRARVVVSGHLHLRTTLWRDGVRYEEVSLGYPRDWDPARGIDWYLRDVLGDESASSRRFVPRRDPFLAAAPPW